jgi:hypothetical protein
MKRLAPDARKHILRQTIVRLQKDWTCRYGQWNTAKLLRELRLLLRAANKPGGLEALGSEEPAEAPTAETLPLFDDLPV